jgi:hypothetical protein
MRRGCTLTELLVLVLVFLSMLAGLARGVEFGAAHGPLGRIAGGALGAAAGAVGALLAVLLIALICEPFERFWRWWRPSLPACENGTCRGYGDYKRCDIPPETRRKVQGLASSGWRCRCGNVYGGGCDYPLLNRFVRILPNGTVRPYLKHRLLGRWRPDNRTTFPSPPAAGTHWTEKDLPGWLVPLFTGVLCGAISLFVVWRQSGLSRPTAPWFIGGCALLGLVLGCVAWRIGPKRRDEP